MASSFHKHSTSTREIIEDTKVNPLVSSAAWSDQYSSTEQFYYNKLIGGHSLGLKGEEFSPLLFHTITIGDYEIYSRDL